MGKVNLTVNKWRDWKRYYLKHGELCVCEIIAVLEKPQPTVSHHLNLLKNAGLLKWRKEGVWIHYKLSNTKLPANLMELLKNHQ